MEREKGFEPSASSLGSWHSTTELLPRSFTSLLWPSETSRHRLAGGCKRETRSAASAPYHINLNISYLSRHSAPPLSEPIARDQPRMSRDLSATSSFSQNFLVSLLRPGLQTAVCRSEKRR